MPIQEERFHRTKLWDELKDVGIDDVEPQFLRDRGIYGGAQGIWVDKRRTATLSANGNGVTMGILHTGRHYPDDISEEGVIYHYPSTGRPPRRDNAEINATKNARALDIPIFIILPGAKHQSRRSVRLGWVADFDDQTRQFLILFGESEPAYSSAPTSDAPFQLLSQEQRRMATVKVRSSQQQFRFQVLAQYGCKCAVCKISHSMLVEAAHICGKANHGSDDWRNGLPLCSTHHHAFDAYLFAIRPNTREIVVRPNLSREKIGIMETNLSPVHGTPHSVALVWRYDRTMAEWGRGNQMSKP